MSNEPFAFYVISGEVRFLRFADELRKNPALLESQWQGKPMWKPLYTQPFKDDEIKLIRDVVGDYVCTLKMEIDQEKQTFKGYERCSNISGLQDELKDAKALDILKKASEK